MNLSKTKAWLQAARLPSQSYIFIPLLLGQSFYFYIFHTFDFVMFFLIQSFGIANQLYIVFANDYADQETDKLNKTFTIFSGGSRVLVDNKLNAKSILQAALVMASLCLIISVVISYTIGNLVILFLALIALLLLHMYSYNPVKLSYRGGGEFLQMLGVGVILPTFGYLGQGGQLIDFPYQFFLPLLLINLSCAMATSLPDVPSDTIAEKKTFAVTMGIPKSQWAILAFEIIAYLILCNYLQITRMSLAEGILFMLPLAILLFSFLGKNALPGTFRLSLFVFFSISFNLSIQVLLILKNFRLMN